MDPIQNPYSPGAGTQPPELSGRDELRRRVAIAIARIRLGNPAKSSILVGLRGVGKTVLLDRMRVDAERQGFVALRIEVQADRSLPSLLAPQIRSALLRLRRVSSAREAADRAFRALSGMIRSLKVKYQDLEFGFDIDPEPGLADSGVLDEDMAALLLEVGRATQAAGTAAILFLDEVQLLRREHFAALIAALHYCAQERLPVAMVGAGLPQLRMLAGDAKSYAERLFDFPQIGPLSPLEAANALQQPAQSLGVSFEPAALDRIYEQTQGYPYFLQEWGKQAWDIAQNSLVTVNDVEIATIDALAELDAGFFRVRFDRLTPTEKRYLRAMAELGPGPHRSGDIAGILSKSTTVAGPLRQGLITKGMIWSPSHGETAFTVPLFDDFMKRVMPGSEWRSEL